MVKLMPNAPTYEDWLVFAKYPDTPASKKIYLKAYAVLPKTWGTQTNLGTTTPVGDVLTYRGDTTAAAQTRRYEKAISNGQVSAPTFIKGAPDAAEAASYAHWLSNRTVTSTMPAADRQAIKQARAWRASVETLDSVVKDLVGNR